MVALAFLIIPLMDVPRNVKTFMEWLWHFSQYWHYLLRSNSWRQIMTDVTQSAIAALPSAADVFNLSDLKIDKVAASNGKWMEVERAPNGLTYIELLVVSTDSAKAYNAEIGEWATNRFEKQGGGQKDMAGFFAKNVAAREAFEKETARLCARHLVKGWRQFYPTMDVNGNPQFNDETGDVIGTFLQDGEANVISDGKNWLKFNSGTAHAVLTSNPEWVGKVVSFAQDKGNYRAEQVKDKSSIAA
jgi:hypothetical protein